MCTPAEHSCSRKTELLIECFYRMIPAPAQMTHRPALLVLQLFWTLRHLSDWQVQFTYPCRNCCVVDSGFCFSVIVRHVALQVWRPIVK